MIVLVIDEDEDQCRFIERILDGQGHTVACISSVKGGHIWLRNHRPDLAVVSAGRQGEQAATWLALLNEAGIEKEKIVFRVSEGLRKKIQAEFKDRVGEIVLKPSDLNDLEDLLNRRCRSAKPD